jgi:SAM-dependent methyltransferase
MGSSDERHNGDAHSMDHGSTEFLNLLRCPDCSGNLEKSTAGLSCPKCRRSFPIADGIIHFVSSEQYVANFGFEWTRYARTLLESEGSYSSEEAFRRKTGFTPEQMKGKWVLDAGCGMGLFAEVASRWGAKVVAIDLSRAAEVAARNLADRNNVWVCQSDLRRLPFAPASFDFIYSIGVLHHTPDCEQSFKGLLRYLKPDGVIGIWLYSAYNKYYRMSDLYRKLTTRLSPRALHTLCVLADPLYHVHRGLRRLPRAGPYLSSMLSYLLPMSLETDRESRVLGTFDWYSPKYQSKHTYEEVFRWFEDSGLVDFRVLSEPIAVQGRKPAEPTAPRLSFCSTQELTDPGDRRALAEASGGSNRTALGGRTWLRLQKG